MKGKGFTLLEVLVSIMILATVLSTVFASYSGTFRIVSETESQAEIYHMARIALERMLEDLESVVAPQHGGLSTKEETSGFENGGFALEGIDDDIGGKSADSLRFLSHANIGLGEQSQPRNIVEIFYSVEEDDRSGRLTLFRVERNLLADDDRENKRGLPLCDNLASVELRYIGLEGDEQDGWDPEEGIPRIVSATLGFVNPSNPETSLLFATSIALPNLTAGGDEEEWASPW